MQRHGSKTSITSIGSSSRGGEKKVLPTHMIVQRENGNQMILLPVTHLVNSSVTRVKLNNTATFKVDHNNRKQERGRILQLGNEEECAEQLQVFEMMADIDVHKKTFDDSDEQENENDNVEQLIDQQGKHEKSSKQQSKPSFDTDERISITGSNRNLFNRSNIRKIDTVKRKDNITSKYLPIGEETEQSSNEQDSVYVSSRDSFDNNVLSEKSIRSPTAVASKKQPVYSSAKKSLTKNQGTCPITSKSQIVISSSSQNIGKGVDHNTTMHKTLSFEHDEQQQQQQQTFNDNDMMCQYEALSKKCNKLLTENAALQLAHDRLLKENQFLKRTTMPIPDAAGRRWFINMGAFFSSTGLDTDIMVHVKALQIDNPRDLIDCIEDTTTNTARQVIKLLYNSYQLATLKGQDVPKARRLAIRAFAESQKGPVTDRQFNEAIDGVFRSKKNELKNQQNSSVGLPANGSLKKPSESTNKGQKTLTQMIKKKTVLQTNSNRTIFSNENDRTEEIYEDNEQRSLLIYTYSLSI